MLRLHYFSPPMCSNRRAFIYNSSNSNMPELIAEVQICLKVFEIFPYHNDIDILF